MYSVNISLQNDLIKFLIDEIECLRNQGYVFDDFKQWKREYLKIKPDVDNVDVKLKFERELIYQYHNLQHKLIVPTKRHIHYPKDFICTGDLSKDIKLIENKIKDGVDLTPHLSRNIFNSRKKDMLLFDWGIHHLHISNEINKKNNKLVEGSKNLLYVHFTRNDAYFIKISHHGEFENNELVKILYINYPFLFNNYEMEGFHPGDNIWSKNELRALRKSGASTCTVIDGKVFYPLGGGIVSSGDSMKAINNLDQKLWLCTSIENYIKEITINNVTLSNIFKITGNTINYRLRFFSMGYVLVYDVGNELLCELRLQHDVYVPNIIQPVKEIELVNYIIKNQY